MSTVARRGPSEVERMNTRTMPMSPGKRLLTDIYWRGGAGDVVTGPADAVSPGTAPSSCSPP